LFAKIFHPYRGEEAAANKFPAQGDVLKKLEPVSVFVDFQKRFNLCLVRLRLYFVFVSVIFTAVCFLVKLREVSLENGRKTRVNSPDRHNKNAISFWRSLLLLMFVLNERLFFYSLSLTGSTADNSDVGSDTASYLDSTSVSFGCFHFQLLPNSNRDLFLELRRNP